MLASQVTFPTICSAVHEPSASTNRLPDLVKEERLPNAARKRMIDYSSRSMFCKVKSHACTCKLPPPPPHFSTNETEDGGRGRHNAYRATTVGEEVTPCMLTCDTIGRGIDQRVSLHCLAAPSCVAPGACCTLVAASTLAPAVAGINWHPPAHPRSSPTKQRRQFRI